MAGQQDNKKARGASPFVKLAPELIEAIFSQVNVATVRSLRLVCKSLSDQAAPYLLPEVTAYFCAESFERLKAISRHPLICQGIKVLWYEVDRLEALDSDDKVKHWHETLKEYGGGTWPEWGFSNGLEILPYDDFPLKQASQSDRSDCVRNTRTGPCKEPALAFAKYTTLVHDQARLQQGNLPLACFTALFAASPRLHHIRVTIQGHLRRMTVHETEPFRGCGLQSWEDICSANLGPDLTTVLIAAYDAGRLVKSLAAAPISRSFFSQEPGRLSKLTSMISRLEDLRFEIRPSSSQVPMPRNNPYIGCGHDTKEYDPEFCKGDVATMLSYAKDLQHLELLLPPVTHLTHVIGETVWPKLRCLRIHTFVTTLSAMRTLIDQHTSLHTLRLSDGELSEGTWQAWIDQYAGKWKSVKDVKLRNIFSSVDSGSDCEFGNENPEVRPMKDGRQWDLYIQYGGKRPDFTFTGSDESEYDSSDEWETDESGDLE